MAISRQVHGPAPLRLERVAVDTVEVALELVHELADFGDLRPRHDPERLRLAAPAVELAGVRLRERVVWRDERAGVLERLALALLAEHLVDHAASSSSSTASACSPPCCAWTMSGMPCAPFALRSSGCVREHLAGRRRRSRASRPRRGRARRRSRAGRARFPGCPCALRLRGRSRSRRLPSPTTPSRARVLRQQSLHLVEVAVRLRDELVDERRVELRRSLGLGAHAASASTTS